MPGNEAKAGARAVSEASKDARRAIAQAVCAAAGPFAEQSSAPVRIQGVG
jgi:hypothetical protein